MRSDAALRRAIARAEAILPGRPAPPGEKDPRWQAIMRIGDFIPTHPEPVCDFAMKWARRRGLDLQSAIYCCLIEHLLEHHFDLVFPRMRKAALENKRVAKHFDSVPTVWLFGQAQLPKNKARLRRLATTLQRKHQLDELPSKPTGRKARR